MIKGDGIKASGFLISFMLIAFIIVAFSGFAVADYNGNGSGGEGISVAIGNDSIDQSGLLPYIDQRILEAFNNATEVTVIVKVRDTSGISISSKDSIEQQNIKDLQRKELLGNKMDSVLSKLPADGFKLKGKFLTGRGFYGSISKAVFDKLINDSAIGAIYLNSVSDLGGWRVASEEELNSDEAVKSANTISKNTETNFSTNRADDEISHNIIQLPKSEKSWFHKLISFLKLLFGLRS